MKTSLLKVLCVVGGLASLGAWAQSGSVGSGPAAATSPQPAPILRPQPSPSANTNAIINEPSGALRTNSPSLSLGTNTPTPLNKNK